MKRQLFWLTSSRLLGTVLQGATLLIFLRVASVAQIGVVGIVTSISVFAASLFSLGVGRFIATSQARGDRPAVSAGLALNQLSTVALVVVGLIGLLLSRLTVDLLIPMCLLWVALAIEKNLEVSLEQAFARQENVLPTVVTMVRRTLTLLLVLVGLWLFEREALWVYVLALLVGNSIGSALVHGSLARQMGRLDRRLASLKRALLNSRHFYVADLSNQAASLDSFFVGLFGGTAQAAYYSSATRLVNPLRLLPVTIGTVLLPFAARSSLRQVRKAVRQVAAVMIALELAVLLSMPLLPELVPLVLGEHLRESTWIFGLALAGLPVWGLAQALTSMLQGIADVRFVAITSLATGVASVLGFCVGGALAGAFGVAVTVLAVSVSRLATLAIRFIRLSRNE
ncbi:lipopolysaccharide biosynthesis protein [Curtobacterium sp. 260]|uniref:lipopolysaccharide biosynthesis protein n=1 Tax=Curtobacterium sp. 260 TaxID=2817748 RepID=UPI002787BF5A|nr:hypothetical protein [Curtobacterium sp. 260]MDP9736945.1 O-antigen/teichoic acid export membrane protein [Curtobacterium sp. 260]